MMTPARRAAIHNLLTYNVARVINRRHLEQRLRRGEKLRVKLGMDPTAPDLHLGSAVALRKLRDFQKLGHQVIFIIGDATARVGDPTGRSRARPLLAPRQIRRHADTYFRQVGKVVDVRRAEIRFNSEWWNRFSWAQILELLGCSTVARVLERAEFAERRKRRAPLGLHELIYPLLQAYDSVAVKADVELGGTDQTFNLLMGRQLQPRFQQEPQDIVILPLLVGLDGRRKMSKSAPRGAVGLTEPPSEMIGRLMTIPDAAIMDYARLAADWPASKLKQLPRRLARANPRDVKLEVARDIAALYHGAAAARKAAAEWWRVFHHKELPAHLPLRRLRHGEWPVAELLVSARLASSKSEARRLVEQGGVRHNGVRVTGTTVAIAAGDLLQVGKRRAARVK